MRVTKPFHLCKDKFVFKIPRPFDVTLQCVATGTKLFSLLNKYLFVDYNKYNILIPVRHQEEFLNV